jgi:hypothetical protein
MCSTIHSNVKLRAWSLICNEKLIVLFCHATEKFEAISCARRCRSSRLTRWWTQNNNLKKWRAEEEERHKGLVTPQKCEFNSYLVDTDPNLEQHGALKAPAENPSCLQTTLAWQKPMC